MQLTFLNNNKDCNLCGNCKKITLDEFKHNGNSVVVIGDGTSDTCVAKYADKVFAKRSLKLFCEKNNISYTGFETFRDIINNMKDYL